MGPQIFPRPRVSLDELKLNSCTASAMVTDLDTDGRNQNFTKPHTLTGPIIYKLIPHYAHITIQNYLYSQAAFRQVSVAVADTNIIKQEKPTDQNTAFIFFRLSYLVMHTQIYVTAPKTQSLFMSNFPRMCCMVNL